MQTHSRGSLLLSAVGAAALVGGCQLLVNGDVASGLGAPCSTDDDCHASRCIQGICVAPCAGDGCGKPDVCTGGGCNGTPAATFRAGVLYSGDPSGNDQWAKAHEAGLLAAESAVPSLSITRVTDVAPERTGAAIDELVGQGVDAIVTTAPSMANVAIAKANEYPELQFFTSGLFPGGPPNHHGYYARIHHAAYIAGYVAAWRSASKYLGVVASHVTPAALAYINAFALGARRKDPNAFVSVGWVRGGTTETDVARQLLAMRCDVLAHVTGSSDVVATALAQDTRTWAIGNNIEDACPDTESRCLATTFWNWGPLYTKLFQELSQGSFAGGQQLIEPFLARDPASVAKLDLASNEATAGVGPDVEALLDEVSAPGWTPFRGALYFTNGYPPLGPGAPLSDEELRSMCWFVVGSDQSLPIIVVDPDLMRTADQVPQEGDCALAR